MVYLGGVGSAHRKGLGPRPAEWDAGKDDSSFTSYYGCIYGTGVHRTVPRRHMDATLPSYSPMHPIQKREGDVKALAR
jgi:hypothetical protein